MALRGIDLVVTAGELVCLIGANGAGKSSTLRAISGLLRPNTGRILFEGREIQDLEPATILESGIAHCPEGRRIFPHLTSTRIWQWARTSAVIVMRSRPTSSECRLTFRSWA